MPTGHMKPCGVSGYSSTVLSRENWERSEKFAFTREGAASLKVHDTEDRGAGGLAVSSFNFLLPGESLPPPGNLSQYPSEDAC